MQTAMEEVVVMLELYGNAIMRYDISRTQGDGYTMVNVSKDGRYASFIKWRCFFKG